MKKIFIPNKFSTTYFTNYLPKLSLKSFLQNTINLKKQYSYYLSSHAIRSLTTISSSKKNIEKRTTDRYYHTFNRYPRTKLFMHRIIVRCLISHRYKYNQYKYNQFSRNCNITYSKFRYKNLIQYLINKNPSMRSNISSMKCLSLRANPTHSQNTTHIQIKIHPLKYSNIELKNLSLKLAHKALYPRLCASTQKLMRLPHFLEYQYANSTNKFKQYLNTMSNTKIAFKIKDKRIKKNNTRQIKEKIRSMKSSSSLNQLQTVQKYAVYPTSKIMRNYHLNEPKQAKENAYIKKPEHAWCIALAPLHLHGLDGIGKAFGRGKSTVKAWHQQGAPIVFDGLIYFAEYNTLFAWFLNNPNMQS